MSGLAVQDAVRREGAKRSIRARRGKDTAFVVLCVVTACVSVIILGVLLAAIFIEGFSRLDWSFLHNAPNPKAALAGIRPALFGTIWVSLVCAFCTLPIGAATAVFMEEFKPTSRLLKWFHGFVQLNIGNLAGVPSVVYGILGLTAFVNMFGLFGNPKAPMLEFGVRHYDQFLSEGDAVLLVPVSGRAAPSTKPAPGMTAITASGRRVEVNVVGAKDPLPDDVSLLRRTLRADAESGRISRESWRYLRLPFGRSVLTGGLTLMLVILPIVIISSQEALRAVPDSLREGALGMGATRWQMVRCVTLPASIPGIMTGAILAMSRAIGEAAPILMIAGIVYITSAPEHLMDDFTVMPLQIYNWVGRPQKEFHEIAASGIIVLLSVLLSFNTAAVFIRQRFQRPLS